jgi:hypothetical protein
MEQVRHKYWIYRGDIDPWFWLLVRKGPRGVWRRLRKAPVTWSGILGYSRIARGDPAGPDVEITIYPEGSVEQRPQVIDPRHMRAFLGEMLPGRPVDPHFAARVPLTHEPGPRSTAGFAIFDPQGYFWVEVDDLDFKFASTGLVAIAASSVHGLPSDDRPLFDVVDLLLPLYLGLVAVSSGACDRVFGYRGARHRFHWELTIAEDIVFPTPLAGDRAVGFPDRVPASIPLGGRWREPSQISFHGWSFSRRQCRPRKVVESVLGELLVLWGFEADPVVVDEVLARLRATRLTQPSVGRP